MRLPDNYFRERTPAEIIAKVATITLGNISLLGSEELKRIGWLDNPIIDILYSLTSAGVWIARTDTSGRAKVQDSVTSDFAAAVSYLVGQGTVCAAPTTSTLAQNQHPRRAQIALNTDGAGACAATNIAASLGAYYPVCRLKRIISNVADAATTLNFTVSGGALLGPASMSIALVANVMYELNDILLYDLTDATSILCAIADGPISATIWLEVEYWQET